MNNVATCYSALGKNREAIALYKYAVASLEKRRFQQEGAGTTLDNLASCYETLKQFDQAEVWRRKSLSVVKEQAGADSLPYSDRLARLGHNLLQQKKWAAAEPLLRECLQLRDSKAPDHWTTSVTRFMVGQSLLGQKQYAKAEPLLLAGYRGFKEREAKVPPRSKNIIVPVALRDLVQLYEALNKPAEAAKWRQELQEHNKSIRR